MFFIFSSVAAGRLLSYIPYQLYTGQTKLQQGLSSFATETSTKICNSTIAGICTKNSLSRNLAGENGRGGNFVEMVDEEGEVDEVIQSRIKKIVRETESGTDDSDSDNEFGQYLVESEQKQAILDDSLMNTSLSDNEASTSWMTNGAQQAPNTIKTDIKNSSKSDVKSPSPNGKPHGRAGDPHYLNEFYSNSRLHHLSTWKSEWREYVNKKSKELTTFPGKQALVKLVSEQAGDLTTSEVAGTLSAKPNRVIMHVDMDCFFVSVGLRKRPDLIGER